MKRVFSLFLCLLLIFAALPMISVPAKANYTLGSWEFSVFHEEAAIQKYYGSAEEVEVPSVLGGYPVTEIGSFTFYGNQTLKTVSIPESVRSIGIKAFFGCSNLTTVYDASGVKTIGSYAFGDCTGLKYVMLPENLEKVGWNAFSGCTNLISVMFPISVTEIGGYAFEKCTGLTGADYAGTKQQWDKIAIGPGNEPLTLGTVQYDCGSTVLSGTCGENGNNVTWQLDQLGSGIYSLSIFGTGRMKDYASGYDVPWEGYHGMIHYASIEVGVMNVGANAFQNCDELEEVQIPGTVTEIGEYAFLGCSTLTSVTLPAGLTGIGEYAFYGCSGLTGLALPAGVSAIGRQAFFGCTGLTRVDITDLAAWCAIDFISVVNPLIYAQHLYLNGTEITDLAVPYGVKRIGNAAFYYCQGLTGVTIPAGVETIGSSAFEGCVDLTGVTIPKSMKRIEAGAFWHCNLIQDVWYCGTPADWNKIVIESDNDSLTEATVHYSAPEPLVFASVTADMTLARVGEPITWTASAVGGTGALKYCFYVFRDGNIVERGAYGTGKTYTYTPDALGTVSVRVYAKDSAGKTAVLNNAAPVSVVDSAEPFVYGVTASVTSAKVGESITWTASGSGTGVLKYCFYVFRDGKIAERGAYGTAKTYTYTPAAAGTHTVKVYVKDSAGKVATKEDAAPVTVTPSATPFVTGVTVNRTTASVGQSVTWTAAAAGGSGPLKFCFYVFRNGKVAERGSYGTAKTYTYTPAAPGTYTVRVYVKDSSNAVSAKDNAAPVTVTPSPVPVILGVTANKTASGVGQPITWTAVATGGSGTLKYCFYVFKDGKIAERGSYGTSKIYTYTPAAPGTYTVRVYVKDGNNVLATKDNAAPVTVS